MGCLTKPRSAVPNLALESTCRCDAVGWTIVQALRDGRMLCTYDGSAWITGLHTARSKNAGKQKTVGPQSRQLRVNVRGWR